MTKDTFNSYHKFRGGPHADDFDFTVQAKNTKDGIVFFPDTAVVTEIVPVSAYGLSLEDYIEELQSSAEGLDDVVVDTQYGYEYSGVDSESRTVIRGNKAPSLTQQEHIRQVLDAKASEQRSKLAQTREKELAELARLQEKYNK